MISEIWSADGAPTTPLPATRDGANGGVWTGMLGDAELDRVLRLMDPGPTVLPPGEGAPTFFSPSPVPGQPLGAGLAAWQLAWNHWQENTFGPVLAPALARAATLAAGDRARELREVDLALAGGLEPAVRERARVCGRRLLARLGPTQAARWADRFKSWAADGQTPALFPTVYAAGCALFHLPLRPALLSYAFLEWRAAGAGRAGGPPADTAPAALAPLRGRIEHALRAVASLPTTGPRRLG